MREADLPDCGAIAEAVHLAHPEDEGRMAERFHLFPDGCFAWREGGRVLGYAVSHPWRAGAALALNTRLRALPAGADALYLHDLALLPGVRGRGSGRALVRRLDEVARAGGLTAISLVAVGGTGGFWERAGFRAARVPALDSVLRTYDAGAAYMERAVAPA